MSELQVTLSFEAAEEIFRRLQAYDSTLDLGFNDAGSKAFEELRRELDRCSNAAKMMRDVQELSERVKEQK